MRRNKEVQNYMFGKRFYISREKNHWIWKHPKLNGIIVTSKSPSKDPNLPMTKKLVERLFRQNNFPIPNQI